MRSLPVLGMDAPQRRRAQWTPRIWPAARVAAHHKKPSMPSPALHDPSDQPLPAAATDVRETTCCMGACRCGIRVPLRQGESGAELRWIEGNPDHPLNQGAICVKGSSGIFNQY